MRKAVIAVSDVRVVIVSSNTEAQMFGCYSVAVFPLAKNVIFASHRQTATEKLSNFVMGGLTLAQG